MTTPSLKTRVRQVVEGYAKAAGGRLPHIRVRPDGSIDVDPEAADATKSCETGKRLQDSIDAALGEKT
jgi:uncharacterized protein (DUF2126 family)